MTKPELKTTTASLRLDPATLAKWRQGASDEGLTDAGLKIRTLRLPDLFQDHDSPDKQYDAAGLNAPHIVDAVLKALRHNSAGIEEARA